MFKKEIDKNNREEMVAFLKNHYRYFTMRSWNRSTSYANNMKIYNLHLPFETKDKLYDMLEVDDVWFQLGILKEEFAKSWDSAFYSILFWILHCRTQ